MEPSTSLPQERLESSIAQLRSAAETLNRASDSLSREIGEIEAAVKALGLGVTHWYTFSVRGEGPFEDVDQLGYARVKGAWCVCLRTGDDVAAEELAETWPFSEAPRALRVQAVDHLIPFLESLSRAALDFARTVDSKAQAARTIAATVKATVGKGRKP